MIKPLSYAFPLLVSCGLALAACGDSSDSAETSAAATSGSGGDSSTGSGGGATTTTSGSGGEAAQGLAEVGTYVVLGDSISDKGGQSPFFYDLLVSGSCFWIFRIR